MDPTHILYVEDKLNVLKNFLINKNKNKLLIIIGDSSTGTIVALEEYNEFLKNHEKKLKISLKERHDGYNPYFYLTHYENIRQLYLANIVDMFNPYILYNQGEEIKCPYFSINEDKETFIIKQIYIRSKFDKFVEALMDEYNDKYEIAYFK
jgi:hypothetical protein